MKSARHSPPYSSNGTTDDATIRLAWFSDSLYPQLLSTARSIVAAGNNLVVLTPSGSASTEIFRERAASGSSASEHPLDVLPLLREQLLRCSPLSLPARAVRGGGLRFALRHPLRTIAALLRAAINGHVRHFLVGLCAAASLERHSLDLIHADAGRHETLSAQFAATMIRSSLTVAFTAADAEEWLDKEELGLVLKSADGICSTSGYDRDRLIGSLGDLRDRDIVVVHAGIDTSSLPEERQESAENLLVCPAGTLRRRHGVPLLLEACRILRGRSDPGDPEIRCVIVGSDPDGKVLRRLRAIAERAGLSDFVELPGPLPIEDMLDLVSRASGLLMPLVQPLDGDVEGIPGGLLHAMAMGVPVVCTDVGGVGEVLEDGLTGRIVPSRNPEALADAIEELVSRDQVGAAAMARAARERILSEFSVEKRADELLRFWKEALER